MLYVPFISTTVAAHIGAWIGVRRRRLLSYALRLAPSAHPRTEPQGAVVEGVPFAHQLHTAEVLKCSAIATVVVQKMGGQCLSIACSERLQVASPSSAHRGLCGHVLCNLNFHHMRVGRDGGKSRKYMDPRG